MSNRPHYPESWRPPPQQCDSWRPSTEQPNSGPDKCWTGTHVRYEEKDRFSSEGRIFPARVDSGRPHGHESHTPTRRDEDHDQGKRDCTSRSSTYRTFTSPPPARPAVAKSGRSQSDLNPSIDAFQPDDVRQVSSSNEAVPATLRSAKMLSNATSRDSGENLNTLIEGSTRPHGYSLRSRQGNTAPLIMLDDVSFAQRPSGQIATSNGSGSAKMFNALQPRYKHKQTPPQRVSPPPAPAATDLYLTQARLPPLRCAVPKKLLVVLDLNGTLLVRPNRSQSRVFIIRPGVHQLLDYLFANHAVMIYSSARPENTEAMVEVLVSKKRANSLAAVWGRDKLGLTAAQYNEKVQVYKKLEKVWGDEQIQATCVRAQRWNQANTVLVDDNHLKALSQPHNLVQVPEFTKKKLTKEEKRREHEIVASIRAKLEELKWANDVSRQILRWQTGEIEPPRASRLSPLPTSPDGKPGWRPSQIAESTSDIVESVEEGADAHAALQRDMENLTTEPSARDELDHTNEPAISAEEWKAFLN